MQEIRGFDATALLYRLRYELAAVAAAMAADLRHAESCMLMQVFK